MTEPKYPDITVQLTGRDGNAYSIMGRVARELKRADVPDSEIKEYYTESQSGDYNNLLRVAMRWVNAE